MTLNKVCKTVCQHNKEPVSPEDMQKLQEIAHDYSKVKNYVYQRYGGIKSLSKIYPGYTVQNEMTKSGLRTQLGLPSVYFYLAVFDALGDIKTQWTRTKSTVTAAINDNVRFTPEDRHYLRFVIKVDGCLDSVLNGKEILLPEKMQESYRGAASGADVKNLNRYLCRQVRRRLPRLHTDNANGFSVAERAYRYGCRGKEHGIFLSTKESRRRIFIPLTDPNEYKKQLYIKLKPAENSIEIAALVEASIRRHKDYENEIGLSPGIWQMFTTHRGTVYGGQFGELHRELTEFMTAGSRTYRREGCNNPGRKKYESQRQRLNAKLETYVNQEINRLLRQEKPKTLYIPKLPRNSKRGKNGRINYSVTVWRRGYINKRLMYKCRENGVETVEVIGKDISAECSACGALGVCENHQFRCERCGYKEHKKINAARNALKRGRLGQGCDTALCTET